MSTVFLDTVGLIALWNDSDQWHSLAHAYAELRKSRANLVTTQYENRLIDPSQEDWNHAWAAFDLGKPGDAGIVDLVSFAVMQRLSIRQALTNDRHFNAAGFETLF